MDVSGSELDLISLVMQEVHRFRPRLLSNLQGRSFLLSTSVVLKLGLLGQQHQRYLRVGQKCRLSCPTPDLLNQKLTLGLIQRSVSLQTLQVILISC